MVSIDRDLTMNHADGTGDLFLGGNYGSFGWVGFENPDAFQANEEIELLGSVTQNPWTYYDIATVVNTFVCGVAETHGHEGSLEGATFTVKLRLTDPVTGEKYDVNTITYTFGAEEESLEVEVATLAELQAAIDNAVDGTIINLVADIEGDVTVTQKPDVKFTIDGKTHTFAGVITIDGKSSRYETAGVTIKNIKFVAESISADACIRLGHVNAARYTNNVTIDGCLFNVPGAVGVKSYTGGDHNLTIKNCFTTSRCHSLAQLKNVEKGLVISGCGVYSKNGINLNSCETAIIENCDINVTGYAVRFGDSGAANTVQKTFTIKNSTLTSACDDGDGVIIFRGNGVNAKLTLVDTTVTGDLQVKGATAETVIIGLN